MPPRDLGQRLTGTSCSLGPGSLEISHSSFAVYFYAGQFSLLRNLKTVGPTSPEREREKSYSRCVLLFPWASLFSCVDPRLPLVKCTVGF